jgi:hypothetical protein
MHKSFQVACLDIGNKKNLLENVVQSLKYYGLIEDEYKRPTTILIFHSDLLINLE